MPSRLYESPSERVAEENENEIHVNAFAQKEVRKTYPYWCHVVSLTVAFIGGPGELKRNPERIKELFLLFPRSMP